MAAAPIPYSPAKDAYALATAQAAAIDVWLATATLYGSTLLAPEASAVYAGSLLPAPTASNPSSPAAPANNGWPPAPQWRIVAAQVQKFPFAAAVATLLPTSLTPGCWGLSSTPQLTIAPCRPLARVN